MAKKKASKPKTTARAKKAGKTEKGQIYYCEVCGAEMVCTVSGAGEVICCEEPMCMVC